jgi:hypothetical protein
MLEVGFDFEKLLELVVPQSVGVSDLFAAESAFGNEGGFFGEVVAEFGNPVNVGFDGALVRGVERITAFGFGQFRFPPRGSPAT